MRLIAESETRRVLTLALAAAAVAEAYRAEGEGRVLLSSPAMLTLPGSPHRLGAKGAALPDRDIAGLRLMSLTHPRLMLSRLSTGEPLALIDESWMYRFRTGVSAAVVARMLAPQGAETVAVIGAGPIGYEMVRAFAGLLAPQRILVAARSPDSAQRLAARVQAEGLRGVAAAPDAATAAGQADLVATITSSREAFLHPGDLAPGATVLSMGGGPEFGHGLWTGATARFVDHLDYALGRGDVNGWIAAGLTDAAAVAAGLTGTIGALAAGRVVPPPGGAFAIVQGMAALDVALADLVFRSVEGGGE